MCGRGGLAREALLYAVCRCCNIALLQQPGDDDDAFGAGCQYLGQGVGVDAAYAEGGHFSDKLLHGSYVLQSDGGATGLGAGGEERAESDVVCSFGFGLARLVETMRRSADNHALAYGATYGGQISGILTYMYGICAEFSGGFRVVIEHKDSVCRAAESLHLTGYAYDGGHVCAFCAQLKYPYAAAQQFAGAG